MSGVNHSFNSLDELKQLCQENFLTELVVQNHEQITITFANGLFKYGAVTINNIGLLKGIIEGIIFNNEENVQLLQEQQPHTLIPLTNVNNPFFFMIVIQNILEIYHQTHRKKIGNESGILSYFIFVLYPCRSADILFHQQDHF